MKRTSEADFGQGLRRAGLSGLYVYRPPDARSGMGVTNWKPCDFMAWWTFFTQEDPVDEPAPYPGATRVAWFEVKDVTTVNSFAFAELRPSQLAGIVEAHRTGIPYYLAIYWRKARAWTISDAWRVLGWRDEQQEASSVRKPPASIPRELLMSRFGIDATKTTLPSVLADVMRGGLR